MPPAVVYRAPAGEAGARRRTAARRPALQALLLTGLAAMLSAAPTMAADPASTAPQVPAAPAAPATPSVAGTPAAPNAPAVPGAPDRTLQILASVPTVTAAGLLQRLAQPDPGARPIVLDVRTAEEYTAGHVPGARNIAHDQLATRLAELADARDREIVVYCRSGRRAASAIETLRAAGYRNLSHLEGDFLGWQAGNFQIDAPPAPRVEPTQP